MVTTQRRNTYDKGLVDEAKVITHLKVMGIPTTVSTVYENIVQDIDCWVTLPEGRKSVSIKTQDAGLTTGNLVFELEVFDSVSGQWEPSWWTTGQSDYILFKVGPTLYLMSKATQVPFDKYRSLSPRTRESQVIFGHRHTDARLGICSIQKLLDLGLLWEVARMS